MQKTTFSTDDVKKIAQLAHIPVTLSEEKNLAQGFNSVMQVVDQLNSVDTKGVEPTHQVTGFSNVFRKDVIDEKRMFSQSDALKNAKEVHDGYFVVEQILEDN